MNSNINKIIQFIVLAICLQLICYCTSLKSREVNVPQIIPTGTEKYLVNDPEYIFNQDALHTFELRLPPAALAEIDANPAAERYVEGGLIFAGETLSPVGIRYKGSIGAFVNCLSGSNWTRPSGHKTCTKLSVKVKINWTAKDNKFYGLKKLQFHSQNLDPTQMHERLGYWLFRAMGVPAPRSVHARLIINGVYTGLYALTECIDGRFTRSNFSDGTGNLYKEVWPLNMHGRPHGEHIYLSALRTNEEENPSVELMCRFAREIAKADDNSIRRVIAAWMDIDEIMAYITVDRTIRVDDGPFHWYCFGNCTNHNYFWYEDSSTSRFHLIPWDLDNAFENIRREVNPVTPIADPWGETRADCRPFKYGEFKIPQRSAACDTLTAGWVSFTKEYRQALSRLLTGPLAEPRVNSLLDAWADQIRGATIEADETHHDALPLARWETALAGLKADLAWARRLVVQQIES